MPHRLTDSIGVAYHSLMTPYFTSILSADIVRGPGLNPFPIILCRRGTFSRGLHGSILFVRVRWDPAGSGRGVAGPGAAGRSGAR